MLAQAVKSVDDNSFSLPGTGSTTASTGRPRPSRPTGAISDTIVWQVSHGTGPLQGLNDPHERDATPGCATPPERRRRGEPVRGAGGRADQPGHGRTAYATVDFAKQANALAKADVTRVINAARRRHAGPGLRFSSAARVIETTEQAPLSTSSAVGVLAAAVVLFIAFGSLLAMLLPLVTALAGVGGGLLAITPLTHAMYVVDFAPYLGALIGLGVGIDYALFIVTRHRRGLQAGLTPADAAIQALNTSGRAVLFAGSTVCIAPLGILVLGVGFLNGLAVASCAHRRLHRARRGHSASRATRRVQDARAEPATATPGPRQAGTPARETRPARGHGHRTWCLLGRLGNEHCGRAGPGSSKAPGGPRRGRRHHHGTRDPDALGPPRLLGPGQRPGGTTTRKAYDLMAQGFGPGFYGPLAGGVYQLADHRAARRSPKLAARDGRRDRVSRAVTGGTDVILVIPKTSPESGHNQPDQGLRDK